MTTNNNRQYQHGGNVYNAANKKNISVEKIIDFSANINPFGPPEWLRPCISAGVDSLLHYPDPYASEFIKVIAQRYGLDEDTIIVANGSTELLYQLPRVLGCTRAVIPVPCYVDYSKVMEQAEIPVIFFNLSEEENFAPDLSEIEKLLRPGDLLVLGSPNNPTGCVLKAESIKTLALKNPESLFLVDEAFLDFVDSEQSLAGQLNNCITLHSLTKFYAIPGLRLGYGVFPMTIAEKLKNLLPPWTVNSLAQNVGLKCVQDFTYQKAAKAYLNSCKESFADALANFKDLTVFPSAANYFLIKLSGDLTVATLAGKLYEKNILIRNCQNYHNLTDRYFRIAIRNERDNFVFIAELSKILKTSAKIHQQAKTPAIMFQGTSSNAGKSILTAALCRILLQDGVRVAPFKAQNMSLNSFVTIDGLEMGRAQVVQAQAARLDPDVRMNPILLKPNSETGSQVIVRGKPVGNMGVFEYVKYKKTAMDDACNCYDDLASDFDAIILEGAGSPGEVNLKRHDIVNMRMARYAESPVILVGDIDRGGVYASFVGTMEVLNQWERTLIAGFLVNRFRGNEKLLQDAHDYVKMHTGKDVLGVIPYIADHGIPEEDSVSFKEGLFAKERPDQDHIEIALISLPHISNFTDIEPFITEPDVYLRIVSTAADLGDPDVIIVPGSKNVIADLQAISDAGLSDIIKRKADENVEIVGVCGGYQMLGNKILDPLNIESSLGQIQGMSLLAMDTELAHEKTLIRRSGTHKLSGKEVYGYEIHHGQTKSNESPLFVYDDDTSCGIAASQGNIWGCYLHGLFDSDRYRRDFINSVRLRKGLSAYQGPAISYDLEPAFDRLADTVRGGLDMDQVYKLLNL